MRGGNNQVWVTSAVTEEEVRNALVLGCSLKRAVTSRRVAVIVSPKVEEKLRNKLYYIFDLVLFVNDCHEKATGLKLGDLAKLTALATLGIFDQAVYLSPSMLAVRNADRIFEEYGVDNCGDFVFPQDGNLKMFLFKPSASIYEGIVKGLQQHKNGPVELGSYLKIWMKNQFQLRFDTLDWKYTQEVGGERMLLGCEKDISLVNLVEVDPIGEKLNLETFGVIDKCVLEYWRKIYEEDVQTLIDTDPLQATPALKSMPQYEKEPIAIVGMSCRFPGSNNLKEFWDLLFAGKDGTGTPPPFRWLREQTVRTKDCRTTNAGFLNVPVDEFDAKFFGVSPKEVMVMDPQHRLLHEVVWEGLEDACINIHDLKGTLGSVFIGAWTNDFRDILGQSGNTEFYRMYMGNSLGAAAARISHLLEIDGPSVATESGCSSAIVGVHMACRSLQLGESNLALACGVNLLLHPFGKDIMPMVFSVDGKCKTFCENANGFARADGCGALVLKRFSDAVRDNDNIWAIIRGSAMAQEGTNKGMGTPTVECESLAMTRALRDAQVGPDEIFFVETHGTGTVVGDPLEVAAIAKAYKSSKRQTPLWIGSVKTNVGHTESCSGITGIIKTVLAMHHEVIPQHINFEKLNPEIDLEAVPARITLEPVEWKREQEKKRFAGVSSFGITGTNAHVILEESPKFQRWGMSDFANSFQRPLQLVKVSAKTDEALDLLLERYQEQVNLAEGQLEDVAYGGNVGRANFDHRVVIIAGSKEELVTNIQQQKFLKGEVPSDDVGKICFLFTGQGSQYPEMAKQLYETSPVFQMHFDLCENILRKTYSIDIKQALWGTKGQEISRTIYSQTSIFCVEYCLLKLWESWGVRPDFVLGHSLGEFAAVVGAGILKVEDALKLMAERSRLIDQLPGGKMLVIKAGKDQVSKAMKQFGKKLDYAAVNSEEQTVVAGDSDVVLQFAGFCTNSGMKSIVLEASHAFHSKHMDPILEEYRQIASTVEVGRQTRCEYISGMRGDHVPATDVDEEYWVRHTREKVSFFEASKKAVELGCSIFIEIGPQPVLSALTMLNNDVSLTCLPSLKKTEQDWVTILESLGKLYLKGIPIDWEGFHQFYSPKKVRLPSYPFIGKKFWPDLVGIKGASIHPLLGAPIPNPSSTKLYQCGFNLNTHEYIKDHALGENIIVPGAAYLEMCMAAGLATLENAVDQLGKPTRPMKVEDLMIQTPLLLEGLKTTEVQTVVDLNISSDSSDWNDMNVGIFHRVNDGASTSSWLLHAKGTFSPLVSKEDHEVQFDIDHFKERLQLESDGGQFIPLQDKLASIGLKLGPSFKRLERVWRKEEDMTLLAKVGMLSEREGKQPSDYILHPTLLDAMVQAVLFSKLSRSFKKKLFVPIKIGKFVWLAGNETEETYIYVYDQDDSPNKKVADLSTTTCAAILLDENGKVLAYMSGVEFIDTTVKAIEAVLEQQTTTMPDLWEEVWRPRMGPCQYRCTLPLSTHGEFVEEETFQNLLQQYKTPRDDLNLAFSNLERLVYCYMLRALYELGWNPPLPGTTFHSEELAAQLGIKTEHAQYFGFILQVLQEEGVLSRGDDPDCWQVIAEKPPTLAEITEELQTSPLADLPKAFGSTLLVSNVGVHLAQILVGKESPLPILFPDQPKSHTPSVADFYEEYGHFFDIFPAMSSIAAAYMSHVKEGYLQRAEIGERFVLRVLEIGAGTGVFTRCLVGVLEDLGVEFEYTFTDISAAFFPPAEKMFEKHGAKFKYKKLNIEEDPCDQGFTPGYYDYVCASDVIHATRDIKESLRNAKILLRPKGDLHIQDNSRVHRLLTLVFGGLEGYWRFTDRDLRPSHCIMSADGWRKAFESTGFEVVNIFPVLNNYHSLFITHSTSNGESNLEPSDKVWLLFHQEHNPVSNFLLEKIPWVTNRQVVVVRPGDGFTSFENSFTVAKSCEQDFVSMMEAISGRTVEGIIYGWALDSSCVSQDEILQPYLYMVKSIRCLKGKYPRLVTLTNGAVPVEDIDLGQFATSTLWGFTKSLQNENPTTNCRVIDIGGGEEGEDGMMQIFYEIWNDSRETLVAYVGSTRYIPKFQPHKPVISDLKLPSGMDRFQLLLPETRTIQDLQFVPLDPLVLGEEEVEMQVKATALNFRDLISVLKPTEKFEKFNEIGLDLAGVIKRVGCKVTKWSVKDEVFAFNTRGGALPSHVTLGQNDVMRMGDQMTFCEAATLPAVFLTSLICLIDIAKVTSEDTVLIHTGSGGVGLSAIQLCQNIGTNIICTAGSKRKRSYLKNLGIQHIFHSRNTNYGEQILEVTGGRGVDVVLNSLTSEGFKEATLMACAKGARFVEMSKLSVWQPEEVAKLRPDVEYTIFDLQGLGEEVRETVNIIAQKAAHYGLGPIPYVRFDAVNIREALQYMQKAKHIGKIVCVMPEMRQRNGQTVTETPMFNSKSTYLITGGLGGIGLEVCKWMLEKGASYVVLAGKNPPKDGTAETIAKLNSEYNAKVTPVQLDVSVFSQCKDLIQSKIPGMGYPPLRGVMHCAGTLHDDFVYNHEWPTFSSTLKSKVYGTLNLHELTKDSRLEHFVLFSSMAATFGTPMQTNHAAAPVTILRTPLPTTGTLSDCLPRQ